MEVLIHTHPDAAPNRPAEPEPPSVERQPGFEKQVAFELPEPPTELQQCIGRDCFFPPEPCPLRELSVALFAAFALGALTAGAISWSFSKRTSAV